ncbi:ArgP/LysG family DNA-binding transcriptional regulator [Demequina sp. NBRC 110053]|uniref:ArgP/LysG family DNA-binding transcriptional regulator n=1 Tax=Demequina sp. NBRC 110053 TaxID=1570342 RepID=UPI0009FEDB95|nr:ArgP/LysG family DNA-binding transcriptional regulator [Demequina sp. NBRC 110053]
MKVSPDLALTLAAAVDTGSLEAAARALHLTQSAVSQRIAALERLTGQVLLVRSRPVRATPSGEAVIRYARQLEHLDEDLAHGLGLDTAASAPLRLAVNADSLSTWLLPPLAQACAQLSITVELLREDEARTADLLARGEVLAAITTRSRPVPGCTVTGLGSMSYRAFATRDYMARWMPAGVTVDALAAAPVVDFDGSDDLQTRWLRSWSGDLAPPRHQVPSSSEFAQAIALGMGWGMLVSANPDGADLVDLGGPTIDVPLHWQQWRLASTSLRAVADALVAAARAELAATPGRQVSSAPHTA